MRKAIIALVMLAIATPAVAQHRHQDNRRAPVRQQQHYREPVRQQQHYHHNHNRGRINPWVAGAVGLGVLGAGTYYYNQRRVCWEEVIVDAYGRQIYNRYGQPLVQTVCN
jgi:multisubunit Na+/H+ antiporter MnhB subunit